MRRYIAQGVRDLRKNVNYVEQGNVGCPANLGTSGASAVIAVHAPGGALRMTGQEVFAQPTGLKIKALRKHMTKWHYSHQSLHRALNSLLTH